MSDMMVGVFKLEYTAPLALNDRTLLGVVGYAFACLPTLDKCCSCCSLPSCPWLFSGRFPQSPNHAHARNVLVQSLQKSKRALYTYTDSTAF